MLYYGYFVLTSLYYWAADRVKVKKSHRPTRFEVKYFMSNQKLDT